MLKAFIPICSALALEASAAQDDKNAAAAKGNAGEVETVVHEPDEQVDVALDGLEAANER
jgi:hypothetical protein